MRLNEPQHKIIGLFLSFARGRDNGLTLTPLYRFAKIMSFDFIKKAEKWYAVFAARFTTGSL